MSDFENVYTKARKRIEGLGLIGTIPWEQQERLLRRHASEMGGLEELALSRAEKAYEKYCDSMFHMTYDELCIMEDEELADAAVYRIVRRYRHELMEQYERNNPNEDYS